MHFWLYLCVYIYTHQTFHKYLENKYKNMFSGIRIDVGWENKEKWKQEISTKAIYPDIFGTWLSHIKIFTNKFMKWWKYLYQNLIMFFSHAHFSFLCVMCISLCRSQCFGLSYWCYVLDQWNSYKKHFSFEP